RRGCHARGWTRRAGVALRSRTGRCARRALRRTGNGSSGMTTLPLSPQGQSTDPTAATDQGELPLTATRRNGLLSELARAGALRTLDHALAQSLRRRDPATPDAVLAAAALASL